MVPLIESDKFLILTDITIGRPNDPLAVEVELFDAVCRPTCNTTHGK